MILLICLTIPIQVGFDGITYLLWFFYLLFLFLFSFACSWYSITFKIKEFYYQFIAYKISY